jgi:hypothetical protein
LTEIHGSSIKAGIRPGSPIVDALRAAHFFPSADGSRGLVCYAKIESARHNVNSNPHRQKHLSWNRLGLRVDRFRPGSKITFAKD